MSLFLNSKTINDLFSNNYINPFQILGMHKTKHGIELYALLPTASKIWVLKNKKKIAKLQCIDHRGLFGTLIPNCKNLFYYQFLVNFNNYKTLIDDPYYFKPSLQELDAWLLKEGTHLRPYEILGAHVKLYYNIQGTNFRVWAPNAKRISIIGDFNSWNDQRHLMYFYPNLGVWELFIPGASNGQTYKYKIIDSLNKVRFKTDPISFESCMPPKNTSKICHMLANKKNNSYIKNTNTLNLPMSIYEVHLGSWRRNIQNKHWLTYKELEIQLIPYAKNMGFTHIEFLPVHEHPFDGSWGYQPTGLFSPTSRFGTREEFQNLINSAHDAKLKILLDWVISQFPNDDYGLIKFDGTELYEHKDPREGFHKEWKSLIYNFGRNEVNNFLKSNAFYWLDQFKIDGLRVDAVTSIIYRDYNKSKGEWIPNHHGGRENLEGIKFLQDTNHLLNQHAPGFLTIAEESSDYKGVSRSRDIGGLGFSYKWNLGWMHDTLNYMKLDPIYRRYHHDLMTFGMLYNYDENFILPLSHDEVVHGKSSVLNKMPGKDWQKFANLRAYYAWMWAFPGKKLIFMGNEFAQHKEWNHDHALDWHLIENKKNWHSGVQKLVRDLNYTYRYHTPMYQLDFDRKGFEWIVVDDYNNSVFIFIRRDKKGREIIVISNFTPITREKYRFGVNKIGDWHEIINTDLHIYHGSGIKNKTQHTENKPSHGRAQSLNLTLPALSTIWLSQKKI